MKFFRLLLLYVFGTLSLSTIAQQASPSPEDHFADAPGIGTMKRLSNKIFYLVQNTAQGAEIRITTDDPNAIQAIHDFLKFQIEDHRTGDSLEVQK